MSPLVTQLSWTNHLLIMSGCKSDEEYAMSRTMSPMMISQYQLQLPDKEVLRKKLQELANIPQIEDMGED